jgi:hypothetical protein
LARDGIFPEEKKGFAFYEFYENEERPSASWSYARLNRKFITKFLSNKNIYFTENERENRKKIKHRQGRSEADARRNW